MKISQLILMEDLNTEIQNLQTQLSDIDAQIQQRVEPLQRQKHQLTVSLARKQEQQQKENKKNAQQQQQQNQVQNQQAVSPVPSSTPGSSGNGTPGSM